MLTFQKVEGLGNDFLLVDRLDATEAAIAAEAQRLRARAPILCHRRTGVGGDGILLVGPPRTDTAAGTMIVINHDGSMPEMCGNGLRCVAMFLANRSGTDEVTVDTDAGARPCTVVERTSGRSTVRVNMGPGVDNGVVNPPAGRSRTFHRISMGNPHAITFCEPGEDPQVLARSLGPAMEVDATFPGGTNVEFARVEADGTVTLWVWERGCGITDACGTGACATAVAARMARRTRPGATPIQLPGGTLLIQVPDDPSAGVLMTGPARVAFVGTVSND